MLETFDVIAYLRNRRIPYWLEGKNVTSGWVELKCLWCSDKSHHLGVNLDSRFMSCWRCGPKGAFTKFITTFEECDFRRAREIINEFQDARYVPLRRDIQMRHSDWNRNILPPEASDEFPALHLTFLMNRGFDPNVVIPTYRLKAVGHFCASDERLKFKIIIPVIYQGVPVCYAARDVTGRADPPYVNCRNNQAIIPMKECVYNLDTVRDTALIVEGATDVWNMGPGTIATMGMEFTKEQVALIVESGIKKAVVMFDGEPQAITNAHKLASSLCGLIPIVEVMELSSGDPGQLSKEDVNHIRKEVGL